MEWNGYETRQNPLLFVFFFGPEGAQGSIAFLAFWSYWQMKTSHYQTKTKDCAPSGSFQHKTAPLFL